MKRIAVISSNGHPEYEPLIPVVTRAWTACGFDTLVMRTEVTDNPYVSQVIRLFGPLDPSISDMDWVVMSDADIVPLNPAWFQELSDHPIISVGHNLTRSYPAQLPMCYTGALAGIWRQVMPYDRWPGNSLTERSQSMLRDYHVTYPKLDP
jgi:hypothetical protein